jgi:hypothetical protein
MTTVNIGRNTYELRLNTRASIALEKALGFNPITMFMAIERGDMPRLNDMLIMLHAMLQPMNHGMNMDKVYDLYDEYVADGHNLFDLVPVFIEVFQDAGYMAKTSEIEGAEKN